MMGYDVGHALRNAKIPFVFMTGVFKGGRAAADARAQHGAAGYFEKPFEAKKLIDALRGLMPGVTPAPVRLGAGADPGEEPIELSDFDVEVAVEADEPVDAMDLTGRVVLTEDGKVSAVLKGDTVHAGAIGALGAPGAARARGRSGPRRRPAGATRGDRDRLRADGRAGPRPHRGEARGQPARAHHRLLPDAADRRADAAEGQGQEDHLLREGPALLRHLEPRHRSVRPVPRPRREDHPAAARALPGGGRPDRAAHRRRARGDAAPQGDGEALLRRPAGEGDRLLRLRLGGGRVPPPLRPTAPRTRRSSSTSTPRTSSHAG